MFFKSLAVVAAITSAAVAQRPSNTSICDYYTTALLKNLTAENEMTLLTLIVNTAVIGNCTKPFRFLSLVCTHIFQTQNQMSESKSQVSSHRACTMAPRSTFSHISAVDLLQQILVEVSDNQSAFSMAVELHL